MFNKLLLVFGLWFSLAYAQTTFNVVVNGTASHAVPSTLFGLMFEDINQSGDGGLYGELLQNRAFQQVTPGTASALHAWAPLGSSNIAVVASSSPVSSALPHALQLTVPASGTAGFGNMGFWALNVNKEWTYDASFFVRFPSPPTKAVHGTFDIKLQTASGTQLAHTAAKFKTSSEWTQVEVKLSPTATPANTANNFTVSLAGSSALAGQEVEFAMFSLFPPTFKGRKNGMRADVAQTLADMKPGFFRFPGGNNLEGQTPATRWQWNATVGNLVDRPGRQGDWGYVNTDGIGLFEYLQWIEDVGMIPIMAVWSGYTLNGASVAEADLAPYIQQSIDQINFVIGDPKTSAPAAIRAAMGHPEPFELKYIEVGNEDFFSPTTYAAYRWHDVVGNLSAVFPQLTYIATSDNGLSGPVLTPTPQSFDIHVYQTPTWFAQNSNFYDNVARNGQIYFEGEYAAISTNASNIFGAVGTGRLSFPTVQSSVGEAAFMTGLERNSDIVFAASYAPLLQNVANTQWTPNLVSYNGDTVVPSTSYHVQKLFSLNKGEQYLPSTIPSTAGAVFWSVVEKTSTNQVILKVANTGTTNNTVNFQLPFTAVAAHGAGTILTGDAQASNTPDAPNAIVPTAFTFTASKNLSYNAPANSFSVLTVGISRK